MPPPGSPRRILLAGATGYIGRAVAHELCERGDAVTAVVRPPDKSSAIRPETGLPGNCVICPARLDDAGSALPDLADIAADTVVSCIASRSGVPDDAWRVDYRANATLLEAGRRAGARHFVLLSALCVQKPRLEFQRAKLAFEAELAGSGLDYTIVRPTAFFKSLAGQIPRVQAGKPFLVFGTGTETACKPIGERDLARFIADTLDTSEARNRILPIGGPGPAITPRQQGEMLFAIAERPPRFRSVSPAILKGAAGVLAPLGRLWKPLASRAELARIGHYYATESMLVWDEQAGRYDPDATPACGTETLEQFYRRVLSDGLAGQELGAHKLF